MKLEQLNLQPICLKAQLSRVQELANRPIGPSPQGPLWSRCPSPHSSSATKYSCAFSRRVLASPLKTTA
jgi:hypothetical protein